MKYICLVLIAILFAGYSAEILAHPGRTDKKGGHYCRTNCVKWGVKYGVWHCHGKR